MIGASAASLQFANKLEHRQELKATVVGRVPLDPEDYDGTVLGALDDIERIIERFEIDRVIVAPQGTDSEMMLATIQRVKSLGVQVSMLPRVFEVVGSSIEFDNVYGMTVMGVRRFGLTRSSAIVKRALDLVGASLLIVLLYPVLLAIAIAIRINSRGPDPVPAAPRGPRRRAVRDAQVPLDVRRLRDAARRAARAERGRRRPVQDRRRSEGHAGRASCCGAAPSTSSRSC